MNVYVEDKLTNISHDLKSGPYTFATEKGTFNDRFLLTYRNKVTLGTDDFETIKSGVIISSKKQGNQDTV
jgi:hypothetical protein